MPYKKLLLALAILASALTWLVIISCAYLTFRYGYHDPAFPADTHTTEDGQAIYISRRADIKTVETVIVIFPANLVSPWQYQDLAKHLLSDSNVVILTKPNLRLAALAPDTGLLLNRYSSSTHWTLIGHSGGVINACRAAQDLAGQSVTVLAVSGYCQHLGVKPDLALIGDSDQLLDHQSLRENSQATQVILDGGHFSLTDREIDSTSHHVLIKALTAAVKQ